jgi:hypothetical protein
MARLFLSIRFAAVIWAVIIRVSVHGARSEEPEPPPCSEDAMIVFDASGSMAGNVGQGIGTTIPRIDEARHALAEVLPSFVASASSPLVRALTNSATFTSISSQRRTQRTPSCAR